MATSSQSNESRLSSLIAVDGAYAVCRFAPGTVIPPQMLVGPFCSVTRTPNEVSVICPQDAVPEGVACEPGWRCLRVAGTIRFSAVGVLASLTVPLAADGISVFAVSTFDTDYLLVKDQDYDRAVAALRRAGHSVE